MFSHPVAAQVIIWACALLLGYTYFGYPLIVWCLARWRPHPWTAIPREPDVSVVIVAYNEEATIARRLRNLIDTDYPIQRMEIVVVCDGSTDRTAAIARSFANQGVRTIEFSRRRGKSAVLNDVVSSARADIVVLTDVRQRFARRAIKHLVADFADPRVGAVGGDLKLVSGDAGSQIGTGARVYWNYEKFIRRHEAALDSTIGATGAVYAIRRRLFRPIPPDTILDDVLIPMEVVRQGYRVLFEPRAVAFDRTSASARSEALRKTRTIAGNFQLFLTKPWLSLPFYNRLWLQTVSHKGLRLVIPLLLFTAFAVNAALLPVGFYRFTFAAQVLFYGAAIAGRALRHKRHKPPWLNVPYTFCVLNWATVVAFFRFVTGRQRSAWEKAS